MVRTRNDALRTTLFAKVCKTLEPPAGGTDDFNLLPSSEQFDILLGKRIGKKPEAEDKIDKYTKYSVFGRNMQRHDLGSAG